MNCGAPYYGIMTRQHKFQRGIGQSSVVEVVEIGFTVVVLYVFFFNILMSTASCFQIAFCTFSSRVAGGDPNLGICAPWKPRHGTQYLVHIFGIEGWLWVKNRLTPKWVALVNGNNN